MRHRNRERERLRDRLRRQAEYDRRPFDYSHPMHAKKPPKPAGGHIFDARLRCKCGWTYLEQQIEARACPVMEKA